MRTDFQTDILDPPDKAEVYDPLDFGKLRSVMRRKTEEAVARRFPISNDTHTLRLADLKWTDADVSPPAQKKAVLESSSIADTLRGRWELVDNATGETLSKTGVKTILSLPAVTGRGAFIRNGNEYTINTVMRLTPGAYSRRTADDKLETLFNVAQGTGSAFRVRMEPSTGVFYLRRGTVNTPLYPVLRTLGVTDDEMAKTWGGGLRDANREAASGAGTRSLRALADSINAPPGIPKTASADPFLGESDAAKVRAAFENSGLDPVSTKRSLGSEFDSAGGRAVLASSKKLLDISRGLAPEDNRDNLEHQRLYGPAEVFGERILRDGGKVARNLLWKATHKKSLDFMPSGALNPHVDSVFKESRMANYIDGSSPMDVITSSLKISRLGEGGLADTQSAPDDMRLVHPSYIGFIDPIKTSDKTRVGLDMYAARGALRGTDGLLYTKMLNPRTKQYDLVDSRTAALANVTTPDAVFDKYALLPKGKDSVSVVRKENVDWLVDRPSKMFTWESALVPAITGVKGLRLNMGSKVFSSSLPVENNEAPFVRSLDEESGKSHEELIGDRLGNVRAAREGTVTKVTPDIIEITHSDGTRAKHDLYNNFYSNQKGFLNNVPVVKPGDAVGPGALLARSSVTDKTGAAAGGVNLRTAFMVYKGLNYEDGIVISESAAQKLRASVAHKHVIDPAEVSVGKQRFVSLFPGKFSAEQLSKFGDNGLPRPGVVLDPGDPVALAVQDHAPSPGTLGRSLTTDATELWDGTGPVTVTDVSAGKDSIRVFTKESRPAKVADKLSPRHGNKGVIAAILPDNEMPSGEDGRPFDILMSPLGVLTRTNPGAVVSELMLGKVAEKRGAPYFVPAAQTEDYVETARRELGKYNVAPSETVLDPLTGRKIPQIMTGSMYFYRLKHLADYKGSGRGADDVHYTAEGQPGSGGFGGSKRIGSMEYGALIGHGADEFIRDAKLIRGQANDEFWKEFKLGHSPALPGTPLVHTKFLEHLKGSGINVHEDKNGIRVFGMTGADARDMTGDREVTSAESYDAKNFTPIKGGLFDPALFGQDGRSWAHIKLPEPVPNPIMGDSLRRVLNMTQKDYDAVCRGEKDINGLSGGPAIQKALENVDVGAEIKTTTEAIRNSRGAERDKQIKRLRALAGIKKAGVEPSDFMMDRVPVLPSVFRPVISSNKLTIVADANYMYKKLAEARDDFNELKSMPGVPDKHLAAARGSVYKAFEQLTGLDAPDDAKLVNKNVGGLLKWVLGDSPKTGGFQRKVLSTPVDMVGNGVIIPDPEIKLNEIGLPERQAWGMYNPFVVRKLVMAGYPAVEAVKLTEARAPAARKALVEAMSERPVVQNRAPTLHKFSMQGLLPRLVTGSAVRINPSICPGYGADFDGDQMNSHVPVSAAAAKEVLEKMLPEKNLLSVRHFKPMFKPEKEYAQGLWLASRTAPGKPAARFKTESDVTAAYNRGDIDIDTPVDLTG